MSRIYSNIIEFTCTHDHKQGESCKGHKLQIIQDCSSDTVSIHEDDEILIILDDARYEAIVDAIKSLETKNEHN